MNAPKAMTCAVDQELLEDFQGLMEHIGLEPHEALAEAMRDWVGRNAPIYDYEQGEGA